jgi:hypothetical protein
LGSTTTPLRARHPLGVYVRRIFLPNPLPVCTGTTNAPLCLPFPVTPSVLASGAGMLTSCPSPTPFGLGLGPTDPGTINVAQETLGLRRTRFSRVSRYLFRHSHFRALQPCSRSTFSARGTLLYHDTAEAVSSAASVPDLSPDHCRRHTTRPVSYYAFFKWWLLLSQHPGCLGNVTSFAT